ncbi:MAG: c-type cytochrome [Acidiferrobacterales bacterium]|nr:c-type cytochrome [Acidiferrobacterales bacterium]
MRQAIKSFQLIAIIATLAIAMVPASVWAGDPKAGEEKAALCLTCHGKGDSVQGVGTPIISGQYEDYLIQAIKSYRSGARNNPVMIGFSTSLSDKDIEDLAAFYANMESRLFTPTE